MANAYPMPQNREVVVFKRVASNYGPVGQAINAPV
jgi:hypothetical protein